MIYRSFVNKFPLKFIIFYPQKNLKILLHHQTFYSSILTKNKYCSSITVFRKVMKLSSAVKTIEQIFPKCLAEKWDNVGLLIEPHTDLKVSTIFLTNDLTEDVLKEAIDAKTNLIISYHPPIFSGMKALVSKNWKDRIVIQCIANNVALYSPHTACDAIAGGVNDWLIRCFDLKDVKPIKSATNDVVYVAECIIPQAFNLCEITDLGVEMENTYPCEKNELLRQVKISADKYLLDKVVLKLKSVVEANSIKIIECKKPNESSLTGMGRVGNLIKPLSLRDCIEMMKKHAKVDHIRFSVGVHNTLDSEISVIGACAGSGASLLKGVPADLYVTGEMSHHDILDCQQSGINVILCEHSNSERGYLRHLAEKLTSSLSGVSVLCSSVDRDPISIC